MGNLMRIDYLTAVLDATTECEYQVFGGSDGLRIHLKIPRSNMGAARDGRARCI